MTRRQANRILDAVRYGDAKASEALITRALVATGDLGACDTLPRFVEEWNLLRQLEPEEIAA